MKKAANHSRILLIAAPLLVLAACGGDDAEVEEVVIEGEMEEMPMPMPMSNAARVEIVEPAAGATVTGPTVRVVLATHGATVEAADSRQTPGRGHHHIFIDENVTAATDPIPPTSATIIHMGNGAEEFTIPNLAPGPHRVIAVFAFGDHVPNTEVAQDTVEFMVAAP